MLEVFAQFVQLLLALAMTAAIVCVFLFGASMFARWLDADSSRSSGSASHDSMF